MNLTHHTFIYETKYVIYFHIVYIYKSVCNYKKLNILLFKKIYKLEWII